MSRGGETKNSEIDDYQLALQIQFGYDEEPVQIIGPGKDIKPSCSKLDKSLSIVDNEWETIDPNPDVRALFLEFNQKFFWGKLLAVEVKWSPRMTRCAGICCYEGRGGLCSVRLSAPLLKLRPRKDLVETLLHEMIHAFLFVTHNNRDHNGHGPEFCKHMNRINQSTGTNISIYHSFHDEVKHYQQHWWRCEGVCRNQQPFYGFVKRAMNRAPMPSDRWWADHQRSCGGRFIKVKEPPQEEKKKRKNETKSTDDDQRKRPKNQASIDTFISKKTVDSSPPSCSSSSQPVFSEENRFPGKGYALGSAASSMKREEKRPVLQPAAKPVLKKPEPQPSIKKEKAPSLSVPKKTEPESSTVPCPICKRHIQSSMINSHLDECLTLSYLDSK